MIYRHYANKQKVAKLLHRYIHHDAYLIHDLLTGITELDKQLYSTQTRDRIRTRLQNNDPESAVYLNDPVQTRTHLYRFHVKGSNSLEIVLYFLQEKYSIRPNIFPSMFESDWDTSILVNPSLSAQTFNVVVNTLIPIIQHFTIELSRTISAKWQFHANIKRAISYVVEKIQTDPEYESYRKYPITYKEDKVSLLRIHDDSNQLATVCNYVNKLGLGGKGLYVTSNRNGGSNNTSMSAKFYLGRIMASVVASRDMWLPIELLDISMNYQNDDLKFAWETYSEYNIQYLEYDFCVSSPTALYFDIVKCIQNASNSRNQTKKNKIPARMKRIQELLQTMIIPYKNINDVIHANLERHSTSTSNLIQRIRRGLTRNARL